MKDLRVFVSPWLARILLWFLPLSFLIIAFFFPLSRILALTLDPQTLTSENLLLASRVLLFTFYQAVSFHSPHSPPRASLCLSLRTLRLSRQIPSARVDCRPVHASDGGRRGRVQSPSSVHADYFQLSFLFLLSTSSEPLPRILIAHVFYNTTIIIRVVGNALSSLDSKLEAAARSLGADPSRVWWNVTFPLLRPSLLASSACWSFSSTLPALALSFCWADHRFATLEVEIYLRVLRLPNLPLAALLSVIQLVCTILFSILYSRFASRSAIQTAPAFC